MARSRTEYVTINMGANMAMQTVSSLMKMILRFVFIRTLGAQYTGASTVFADVLSMLSLAELGIGSAISFALYKPLKAGDNQRIAALMDFYKKAYRVVAGFVVLVGVILLPFLPYIIKDVPDITENISLVFILFIIDSACSYLLVYKSTLFSAGQKRYVISTTSIAFSIARTAVQCVLLLVFKNYILYLVVGIAETLARNLVTSHLASRSYPEAMAIKGARLDKSETKKLFKDVYALSLYKINTVILRSSDSMIMSAFLPGGVSSVGYLSVYRTLIATIENFINQYYTAVLPGIGNLAADATDQKQFSVFNSMLFISFWCNCFCVTSLFVLTSPFIQLIMGSEYVIATGVLIALLVDSYMVSMMRPVSTFRNANGLFVQGKYRPVATAVLDIAFTLALIKPLGVFGVVISTSLARLLTTFWFEPQLVFRNVFHVSVMQYVKRYSLYTGLTVLSCAVCFFLGEALEGAHPLVCFLYKMALCVIIPNGLIVLAFRKTPEFKEFLQRLKGLLKSGKAMLRRKGATK